MRTRVYEPGGSRVDDSWSIRGELARQRSAIAATFTSPLRLVLARRGAKSAQEPCLPTAPSHRCDGLAGLARYFVASRRSPGAHMLRPRLMPPSTTKHSPLT